MIEIWALHAARLNASKFLPLARRIEFQVGPGNHFAILWIQPLNSDLLENRFPLDLLTGNDLETLHHLPLPIESFGFDHGPSILRNPKAHRAVISVSR